MYVNMNESKTFIPFLSLIILSLLYYFLFILYLVFFFFFYFIFLLIRFNDIKINCFISVERKLNL